MSQYGTFSVTLFMRQPFPIYVPNRRIPNAENWNSGVHMLVALKRCQFIVKDYTNDVLEHELLYLFYKSPLRHFYAFADLDSTLCRCVLFVTVHILCAWTWNVFIIISFSEYWRNADLRVMFASRSELKGVSITYGKQSSLQRFLIRMQRFI